MAKAIKLQGQEPVKSNSVNSNDNVINLAEQLSSITSKNCEDIDIVEIEATDSIIKAVEELKRLENLKQKLQNLENGYKLEITNFMQLNQILTNGSTTLATWKSHKRKSFDITNFKDQFPELYDSHLKETTVRVFKLC